jgi:hypothetical protein
MQTIVSVAGQTVKVDVELNEKGCADLCNKLGKLAKAIPNDLHRYLAHNYADFIFHWADWMKHNGCVQGWEYGQLCIVLERYDFTDVETMIGVCTYIKDKYIEFVAAAAPIAEKFKEDFDFLPQYLRIHAAHSTLTRGYHTK